ncbi:molybdopterin-dependent oxidoreductase [Micromonospora sp. DR5-3]|uniref:molybdopterin-containing oxidoreductase family protein n=1 Tax=unclassified Micromonospora TaxID=2617518 RepID=UPI0011D96D8B|nr:MULTISPECIES: molybdopterin-dependent oxidoreductase [unclassified Micromonospora]MCW3816648.1 molybdopterin-dependent oxidoreductase [Micromonospora sp. DR5-3]TYC23009.1 molybdopterin-dependent oxidoreductase [Micromonospora sp. MP36]
MARTTHPGACPLDCPDTCVWQLTVEDGRAVALRGDRDHPFTRGALCGKVNRYLDAVNGPDRLTTPYVRTGPKGVGRVAYRPASWDEGVERVAAGLRASIDRHGPEAILPYYFAGTMGHVQGWTMGPRLFAHLGASRLDTTICTAASRAALGSIYGGSVGFEPESIVDARLIVLWGANPLATNLHLWPFVQQARERGAHLVTIDPLRTDSAARSDEHVAPLPGTDAALALGLMRHVLDAGAADEEWLAAHTVGWPELAARLGEWPVERAAAECGLPVEAVRRLGERIATTRPTAVRVGLGLQRHHGAGQAIRAICALPLVTGDFRYPGGGALVSTSGHHPIDEGPVIRPPGMPAPRARLVNMSRLAAVLTGEADPPVTSLVVFNANPAATAPDQTRLLTGLRRADLCTVVLEQRWTDTCDYADVVLPATMQPEHLDLHSSYGHHYTTLNLPVTRAPGEALPNTEIFRRIAAALGIDHPRLRDSDEDLARQLLRGTPVSFEELCERTYGRTSGVAVGSAPYAEGGFPTPDGRARLHDPALARRGVDPVVGYTPPVEAADPALARRFPLVLVAPAGRYLMNSTFASLPWHARRTGPPRVHLHPDDAAARGLADGDAVRVHNDRGAFLAAVAVDDATRPGLAFTYKAYWARLSPGRATVNAVTAVRDADLGGAPTFHDCRVEVEPVLAALLTVEPPQDDEAVPPPPREATDDPAGPVPRPTEAVPAG